MKKLLLTILLLSLQGYADPFYGQTQENNQAIVKENSNHTAIQCDFFSQETMPILQINFAQLKFIGVLKIAERFNALFLTNEQKIIELAEGHVLLPSQIQIKQITLKSIDYIDWQKTIDCEKPYQTRLTL